VGPVFKKKKAWGGLENVGGGAIPGSTRPAATEKTAWWRAQHAKERNQKKRDELTEGKLIPRRDDPACDKKEKKTML